MRGCQRQPLGDGCAGGFGVEQRDALPELPRDADAVAAFGHDDGAGRGVCQQQFAHEDAHERRTAARQEDVTGGCKRRIQPGHDDQPRPPGGDARDGCVELRQMQEIGKVEHSKKHPSHGWLGC